MGPAIAIGAHRTPEMAHIAHGASRQLCFHPGDVVAVVPEQGHLGGGERKLQPPLGMGATHLAIQEGGAGAEGQQQRRLTAQQAAGGKDLGRRV